jgi:hypothetical protein
LPLVSLLKRAAPKPLLSLLSLMLLSKGWLTNAPFSCWFCRNEFHVASFFVDLDTFLWSFGTGPQV